MPSSDPSTTPEQLATHLRQPGTVLLDATRDDIDTGEGGGWLFSEPIRELTARTGTDVPRLLEELQCAVDDGFWVAGFLSYEAGYALEPSVFDAPSDGLLGWFGVFKEPHEIKATELPESTFWCGDVQYGIERAVYLEAIATIKEHIRAGDVYQINFTAPLGFRLSGDPIGFYRSLRNRQRVPYGAYLNLGDEKVLSFSPELFFRIAAVKSKSGKRRITTRPMKGTTRRSPSEQEDDCLAEELLSDEKNRAENVMIVDLLRNDLSRISQAGTVKVPKLFSIERYETVIQMTSTITAELKEEVRLPDVFRALFPCGSVTGAPKIRAMEVIRDLEATTRGVYCGAIGYAGPDGSAAFSVPIRTAILREGDDGSLGGRLGIGSGVVWDSDADSEYDECLLKAQFLTDMAR